MQISLFRKFAVQRISLNLILFSGIWFLGLLTGMIAAADLDDLFLPLMRPVGVSIFRQIAAILLPFLFAAIAAYLDKPYLLHMICFFKVITFGFCSMLIYRAYGSAAQSKVRLCVFKRFKDQFIGQSFKLFGISAVLIYKIIILFTQFNTTRMSAPGLDIIRKEYYFFKNVHKIFIYL